MKKLFEIVRNKYLLTTIGIIVWLLFFDKNDVFSQMELMGRLNKLRADKTYYLAEINNNRKAIEELKTNKKSLERFAREKYLMKRDDEDVYVFVKK